VTSAAALGVLAVLVGLLGWTLLHRNPGADFVRAVVDNKRPAAPTLNLPLLAGNGDLRLASLRGRPVVLNFWASWCVACKGEARDLSAAYTTYAPKGVAFVGIDTKDDPADGRAFARQVGMAYTLVHDTGSIKDSFGVNLLPGTFVLDRQGRAVHYFDGTVTLQGLGDVLGTLGVH
jgi:cytochrome c biogenesis protein CcmG/thiol:disulfide interchange protein DsbE